MAIPPRTIRTMQDVRTHSGRSSENFVPYKAYMRMSCLEMEKYRRGQEREKSLIRIKNIEQRFEEIETEKAVLMAKIQEQKESEPAAAQTTRQRSIVSTDASSPKRFKY